MAKTYDELFGRYKPQEPTYNTRERYFDRLFGKRKPKEEEVQEEKDNTGIGDFALKTFANIFSGIEAPLGSQLKALGAEFKGAAENIDTRAGENNPYVNSSPMRWLGEALGGVGDYFEGRAFSPERAEALTSQEWNEKKLGEILSNPEILGQYLTDPRGALSDVSFGLGNAGYFALLAKLFPTGLATGIASKALEPTSNLLGKIGLNKLEKAVGSNTAKELAGTSLQFGATMGPLGALANAGTVINSLKEQGKSDSEIKDVLDNLMVEELPYDIGFGALTGNVLKGQIGKTIAPHHSSSLQKAIASALGIPLEGAGGYYSNVEQMILADKYSGKPYGTLTDPTPNESAAGRMGIIAGLPFSFYGGVKGYRDSQANEQALNRREAAYKGHSKTFSELYQDYNKSFNENIKSQRQQAYDAALNEQIKKQRNEALRSWADRHSEGQMSDEVFESIVRNAQEIGVPVERALATAIAESVGRQDSISPVGAIGVMQLMPETAQELGVDPNNTEENIRGGIKYLKQQYDELGDWDLAHAAYNAGIGNVLKQGGVPPYSETRNYVAKINNYLNDTSSETSNLLGVENYDMPTQGENITEQVAQLKDGWQSIIPQIGGVLKEKFGINATISSAARSAEHNAEVGGVPTSHHIIRENGGDALDIVFDRDMSQEEQDSIADYFRNTGLFAEVLYHDVGSGAHLHLGGLNTENLNNTSLNLNSTSLQERADSIFKKDYQVPEPFNEKLTLPEKNLPINMAEEKPVTSQLIEEWANNRKDDKDTKEILGNMFDKSGVFQNTKENRDVIRQKYGDELESYALGRMALLTNDLIQESTQPKSQDVQPQNIQVQDVQAQPISQNQNTENIISTGRNFLEEIRTKGNSADLKLERQLTNAIETGNVAEIENILKQNGIVIGNDLNQNEDAVPSQQQSSQQQSQQNVVQNNKPPEPVSTNFTLGTIHNSRFGVDEFTAKLTPKVAVPSDLRKKIAKIAKSHNGFYDSTLKMYAFVKEKDRESFLNAAEGLIAAKNQRLPVSFTIGKITHPRFGSQQFFAKPRQIKNRDILELEKVANKHGGFFDKNFTKMFLFKDAASRDAFVLEINPPKQPNTQQVAETTQSNKTDSKEDVQSKQEGNAETENKNQGIEKQRQFLRDILNGTTETPAQTNSEASFTPEQEEEFISKARQAQIRIYENGGKNIAFQLEDAIQKRDFNKIADIITSARKKKVNDVKNESPQEAQPTKIENQTQSKNTGGTAEVSTDNQTKYPVRYKVVEADSLNISHSLDSNGDVVTNENYPAEYQPRDRTRVGYRETVRERANNIKPELLGESENVNKGAPVAKSDGIVLNGNGRVLSTKLAYETGKGDNYKNFLIQNAEKFGLNGEEITAMKKPILVRELAQEPSAADINNIISSKEGGEQLSASEQAKSDAKKISTALLSKAPQNGDLRSDAGLQFVADVINTVATPEEKNAFMTNNGNINDAAIKRVGDVLFVMAYGENALTENAAESSYSDVANVITAAMRNAAPKIAQVKARMQRGEFVQVDLSPITKAAQTIQSGETVLKDLITPTLAGMDNRSAEEKDILGFFTAHENKINDVTKFLNKLADSLLGTKKGGMLEVDSQDAVLKTAIANARSAVEGQEITQEMLQHQATRNQIATQLHKNWKTNKDKGLKTQINGLIKAATQGDKESLSILNRIKGNNPAEKNLFDSVESQAQAQPNIKNDNNLPPQPETSTQVQEQPKPKRKSKQQANKDNLHTKLKTDTHPNLKTWLDSLIAQAKQKEDTPERSAAIQELKKLKKGKFTDEQLDAMESDAAAKNGTQSVSEPARNQEVQSQPPAKQSKTSSQQENSTQPAEESSQEPQATSEQTETQKPEQSTESVSEQPNVQKETEPKTETLSDEEKKKKDAQRQKDKQELTDKEITEAAKNPETAKALEQLGAKIENGEVVTSDKETEQAVKQHIENESIIAWHGSPYDIDAFSFENFGKGQGQSVHGWGLYFAKEQEVAKDFQKSSEQHLFAMNGVEYLITNLDIKNTYTGEPFLSWEEAHDELDGLSAKTFLFYALHDLSSKEVKDQTEFRKLLDKKIDSVSKFFFDDEWVNRLASKRYDTLDDTPEERTAHREEIKRIREETVEKAKELAKQISWGAKLSHLYKVKLPSPSQMIDEAKSLSEQPPKVQEAIKKNSQ